MAARRPRRARPIGIVTEGEGEILALPALYGQLRAVYRTPILRPIFADVDPQSPLPVLMSRLLPRVQLAFARDAGIVLVLLDSESEDVCPGAKAGAITAAFTNRGIDNVRVVIKQSKFENWLIADPGAYSDQRRLFPNAQRVSFPDGRADNVGDAARLIERALGRQNHYSKTEHPPKILARASIETMARNSRSFSKLVRSGAER